MELTTTIAPARLNSFCRTCLQKLKKNRQRYNIHYLNLRIRRWLQDETVKNAEEDMFPGFVCGPCRDKLLDFLDFRVLCDRSHRTVKAMIEKATSFHDDEKYDSNTLVEEAAVYNEIYESDGKLLQFDCIPIPNNESEATNSLENEETIPTINDDRSDSFNEVYENETTEDQCNEHKLIHQQVLRTHPCPKCDSGFNKAHLLQEHLNKVHARTRIYQHEKQNPTTLHHSPEVHEESDVAAATVMSSLQEHQYCRKVETLEGNEMFIDDEEGETIVMNESIEDGDVVLKEFDFVHIAITPTDSACDQFFENEETKIAPDDDEEPHTTHDDDDEEQAADTIEYLDDDYQQTPYNETAEDKQSICSIHIKDEHDSCEEQDEDEEKEDCDISSVGSPCFSDKEIRTNRMTRKTTTVPKKMQRRKFLCDQCNKVCLSQRSLINHRRAHNRIIICRYDGCGQEFCQSDAYVRHYRSKHKGNDLNELAQHYPKTRNGVKLNSRKENKSSGKPISWEIDEGPVEEQEEEEAADVVEEDSLDNKDLMEFDFVSIDKESTVSENEQHVSADDSLNNSSFHIKDELLSAEENDKRGYVDKQMITEILKTQQPLACEECGKVYPNKYKLKYHQYTHKANKECPFRCSQCGKGFPSRATLRSHEICHSDIKKYECPHCGLKMSSKYDLQRHIKSHTNERQYSCPKCPMTFNAPANVVKHVKFVHDGKRPYKCSYCERTFPLYEGWKYHEMTHTGEKPYECSECCLRFIQLACLRRHMKNIHKIFSAVSASPQHSEIEEHVTTLNIGTPDCNLQSTCNDSSVSTTKEEFTVVEESNAIRGVSTERSIADYASKSKSKQKKYEYKFRCGQCHKRCLNQKTLDCHERIHQGLRPHPCPKCERSFKGSTDLQVHLNEVHGKINIKCQYVGCGKEFRRTTSYRQHERLKHIFAGKQIVKPVIRKPQQVHVCDECGKVYRNKYLLKYHQYTHKPKEEYEFRCSHCPKVFPTRHSLKNHERCHSDIKNYECPHCVLKLRTKHDLLTHVNIHTKELQYPCPKCPLIFDAHSYVVRHVKLVHDGRRPYTCRYCDRMFGVYHAWKCHEMIHTGEKPHECPECGLRFIQLSSMKRHMKNIHKAC